MASSSPKPLPPDRIELRPKLVIHRDENPELWERFSKVSPKRQGAFIMFMLHQSLANEKLAAMARTLMEGGAPLPREPLVPAQSGDVAQGVKEPPPAPVAAKVPVACFLGASSWLYVCHDGLDMSCHGVAAVPLR